MDGSDMQDMREEAAKKKALDTAALRALMAKATPGPWEHERCGPAIEIGAETRLGHLSVGWIHLGDAPTAMEVEDARADAALIVAAVNNLPALLDRLERAERERDEFNRMATEDIIRGNEAIARAEAAESALSASRAEACGYAAEAVRLEEARDAAIRELGRANVAGNEARDALSASRDEVERLREALRVIFLGLSAWNHESGEFYSARAWLEMHGQYAGDLGEGERVLLEVARAALAEKGDGRP